jgi:hypothetical protein
VSWVKRVKEKWDFVFEDEKVSEFNQIHLERVVGPRVLARVELFEFHPFNGSRTKMSQMKWYLFVEA